MTKKKCNKTFYYLFVIIFLIPLQAKPQEIFSFPLDFELRKKFPPNEEIQIVGTWEDTYMKVELFEIRRINNDIMSRKIDVELQNIKNVSGEVIAKRWSATLGPFNSNENVQISISITKEPTLEQGMTYDNVVKSVRDKIIKYINSRGSESLTLVEIKKALKPIFSEFDSDLLKGLKHKDQDDSKMTLSEFLSSKSSENSGYIRQANEDFKNAFNMFASLDVTGENVRKLNKMHDTFINELREEFWKDNEVQIDENKVTEKYKGENLPEPVLQSYTATLNQGFERELKFKTSFDSIATVINMISELSPDPYAITVEQIKDWINVEVGFMVVPALDEILGTFNISILFTKRNRDYPYSFSNFFDVKRRLSLNIGTKLFDIDGENVDGTPFHIGLGYKLNRFVSVGTGTFIIKENDNLKVRPLFSVNADILVAKFILSEFAKAINIFSSSDEE